MIGELPEPEPERGRAGAHTAAEANTITDTGTHTGTGAADTADTDSDHRADAATPLLDGERLFHELVVDQARRTPTALAVRCGTRRLTYAELDRASDRLAERLGGQPGGPGQPVAVLVDRSVDLVVALLGVLKAGHAFVPLDPSYPAARRRHMLADSRATVVVSVARLAERAADAATAGSAGGDGVASPDVVLCDAPSPARVRYERAPAGPDDLAYVMYTSGSTGRPKGVAVDQRCLLRGVLAMTSVVRPAPGDVWACVTSPSFDPLIADLFLPLVRGAAVLLATDIEVRDPHALADLFTAGGATIGQATPLVWRALLEAGWAGGLRVALSGGEPLPVPLATELRARCASVWNLYGPTETTVWSTGHRFDPRDGRAVPVGRPLPGTTLHVLDTELRPVPAGRLGEVWIGGDKVARGYHRLPDLTDERFRPDPYGPPGARFYRTGDLGRLRPDGVLELSGRADRQVKIRGHRVEPGEVEVCLTEHPEVVHAVVVARPDADGPRLVAHVQTARDTPPVPDDLHAHARATLPEHAVPSAFAHVRQWPRTPNGKIDHAALVKVLEAPSAGRDAESGTGAVAGSGSGAGAAEGGNGGPVTADTRGQLGSLWQELLDVPRPGLDDDFFALGGHSLLVMRMVAAIRKRFGVRVSTLDVMNRPTVRQLAELIDAERAGLGDHPHPR
ncbi:non-ribosomal peptide synthetase [Streptomyces sp. 71268]|uniref:non-ribosomal peptide synthetase n=1 Tax=Streptomyces sp. 71268 TaxID=3002640 RepID=UPI0023F8380D|nr:non-ribosomal peptide synthetase [Streptomyces sp. 71268]WEV29238.1 non-ribosomal peptide synthetase [Streptomyces sp. 71268]